MDIEAVVGGDLLIVASVIPEQYNLKKLWADIRDLCFDQPIKHATEVRFQVMLPWETSYATLKTETDLQDAFNKLREKKYSWAIFIIKTELDELEKTEATQVCLKIETMKMKAQMHSSKFYCHLNQMWSGLTLMRTRSLHFLI
ncbi:hypothetical protein AB3S75_042786 [Citrus x aurantiifolia]